MVKPMETLTLSGAELENFKLGSTQLNLFIFSKQPYGNIHKVHYNRKTYANFGFQKKLFFAAPYFLMLQGPFPENLSEIEGYAGLTSVTYFDLNR